MNSIGVQMRLSIDVRQPAWSYQEVQAIDQIPISILISAHSVQNRYSTDEDFMSDRNFTVARI